MSRLYLVVEALTVHRDRRCERQPHDRLAVRTNFVETTPIAGK